MEYVGAAVRGSPFVSPSSRLPALCFPQGQLVSKDVERRSWGWGEDSCHAVAYFQNNKPEGSSIVAVPITDGQLQNDIVVTSTEGWGSYTVNVSTGTPVEVDTFQSQDSVVISGNVSAIKSFDSSLTNC